MAEGGQTPLFLGVVKFGSQDYIFEMPERPSILPSEQIWEFCQKLAQKHGLDPIHVLGRFVTIGKRIAEIEENGGVVVAKPNGGKLTQIKVFGENDKAS
jgi:hypothetical protein